jgi:tetratricopeptide (TPR) repeat protein
MTNQGVNFQLPSEGQFSVAVDNVTAMRGEEVGERFGDLDLAWLARDDQARALLSLGRVEEGLRLVDEAMIAATSGELSPIVTGIVYCNTLAFCQDAFEVAHAREWMLALMRWCNSQPAMVEHNGLCQVHRAEVLELGGAWADALDAAGLAADRFDQGVLNQFASGKARYLQGEIHRLRGEYDAAEQAFREATVRGYEPQPGLALLRLGQGDRATSAAAIRRALRETVQRLPRARLLPAFVQIMLAAGEMDDASGASAELDGIAQSQDTTVLRAQAAYATGSVALAGDDPAGALVALRRALGLWLGLAAPYEVARTRTLIGLAPRPGRRRHRGDGARCRPSLVHGPGRAGRRHPGRPAATPAGQARAHRTGGAGAPTGRHRAQQPRDRDDLGDQRAHRRQARPEHPGQGRRVLAHCCKRLRAQARPGVSLVRSTTSRPAKMADLVEAVGSP